MHDRSSKTALVLGAIGVLIAALCAWVGWGGGETVWLWSVAMNDAGRTTWPASHARAGARGAGGPEAEAPAVEIPFDLVKRLVILQATVNGSRPLSFILDTGDRFALIDSGRARKLGLHMAGRIDVGGAGPGMSTGAFVKDAAFSLPSFPGFSQPVTLAVSTQALASKIGHDIDGVVGTNFIRQFVLELDYPARVITLHDKDRFSYSGPGESVAMTLNAEGHPVIDVEIQLPGGAPIPGRAALDIGANDSLVLSSPFVTEHALPAPGMKTIRGIGHGGIGGTSAGRIGRLAGLKIGRYTLRDPVAMFSEDQAGAHADPTLQCSIGQHLLGRFRLFFDYSHDRVIFEPAATFADPFDGVGSGLSVRAEGDGYKTFRVAEVLENSPASESGLQENDVFTRIDDRDAADMTLSDLMETLERPVTCKVTIRRGEQTLSVSLTPRPLV